MLSSGWYLIISFVDRIDKEISLKVLRRFIFRNKHLSIYVRNAIPKDNFIIQMDGGLNIQIKDTVNSTYGAQHQVDYVKVWFLIMEDLPIREAGANRASHSEPYLRRKS